MLKKIMLVLAGFLMALGLMVGLAFATHFFGYHMTFSRARDLDSVVLLTKVQNLRQLVTVKYTMEKVVNYDDPKWYGDSRVVLIAHGVVKAGIDLEMLKPADIHISDTEISINLPPPRVTDVYLDDHRTEIVERSTGLLRPFDKALEQNAREIAVAELRESAEKSGILNDARERAKTELGTLLHQLGFAEVRFEDQK